MQGARRALSRIAPTTTVRWNDLEFTGFFEHRRHLAALASGRVERLTLDRFVAAISPGHTVVDVGAFLGVFTLVAARAVGASGRVISFEPDPLSFRALSSAVTRNGFASRVELVHGAAGASDGVGLLTRNVDDPSANSMLGEHRRLAVPVFAVDDIVGDRRVSVCKIDVEGAELLVLDGMSRHLRDVECLLVECNPSALAVAHETPASLTERLVAAGFQIEALDEKTGTVLPWPTDLAGRGHWNLHARR
jgi:FkbM family methyltransferase